MKTFKRVLLVMVAIVIIGYVAAILAVIPQIRKVMRATPVAYAAEASSSQVIFDLVNEERSAAGLQKLAWDETLARAAQMKLDDMIAKKYFSHTSPDGIDPWHWFRQSGYVYRSAGENLAGPMRNHSWKITGYFQSEREVVNAWMDSPGHRANILTRTYTETGIASSEKEHIVVQLFGLR